MVLFFRRVCNLGLGPEWFEARHGDFLPLTYGLITDKRGEIADWPELPSNVDPEVTLCAFQLGEELPNLSNRKLHESAFGPLLSVNQRFMIRS